MPSKEAIIGGMVDRVFSEIELPPQDLAWQSAIRRCCVSARAVLFEFGLDRSSVGWRVWLPDRRERGDEPGRSARIR